MKKDYVLIDTKKIKLPKWIKFILCYFCCNLIYLAIGICGSIISFKTGIDGSAIMHFTNYIDVFLILTIIHDLLPWLRLLFSIISSILMGAIFMGTSLNIPHPFGLISCLLGIMFIIFYNLFLYKGNGKK